MNVNVFVACVGLSSERKKQKKKAFGMIFNLTRQIKSEKHTDRVVTHMMT
jgi:hypothetical protein